MAWIYVVHESGGVLWVWCRWDTYLINRFVSSGAQSLDSAVAIETWAFLPSRIYIKGTIIVLFKHFLADLLTCRCSVHRPWPFSVSRFPSSSEPRHLPALPIPQAILHIFILLRVQHIKTSLSIHVLSPPRQHIALRHGLGRPHPPRRQPLHRRPLRPLPNRLDSSCKDHSHPLSSRLRAWTREQSASERL